jgi:hypothetical protein
MIASDWFLTHHDHASLRPIQVENDVGGKTDENDKANRAGDD